MISLTLPTSQRLQNFLPSTCAVLTKHCISYSIMFLPQHQVIGLTLLFYLHSLWEPITLFIATSVLSWIFTLLSLQGIPVVQRSASSVKSSKKNFPKQQTHKKLTLKIQSIHEQMNPVWWMIKLVTFVKSFPVS